MAKVSLPSLLIFTDQFAAMIESELPLVEVIANLAHETPQASLQDVLYDIVEEVEHGVDLADALEHHPEVFNDIYVNVVRSGMNAGKLGQALLQLSGYLKNADIARKKLRSALTYPLIVLSALFIAFNGMTLFILPKFSSMFGNMGKDLPAATEFMMAVGDIWQDYWYLFIGAMVMTIVAFGTWIATPDGRQIWDEKKLVLPIMGKLWRMDALAKFLRTFAVQVRNEVNILPALELAAPASGNRFIENSVLGIADDIEVGKGIASAFREHEVFEGIVLQMISSGEESSQIDRLLLSAADYYDRLLDNRVQQSTALINPILTIIVGLLIAGMMVAVFMPVFQMGRNVGGG